jgi:hypothetical protein
MVCETDQMLETNSDAVLAQFNRLIEELLAGNLNRSTFRPWEIQILVDMVGCHLPDASGRVSILRDYQKAVQRRMRDGARVPQKLSEYLELPTNSQPFGLASGKKPRAHRSKPRETGPMQPATMAL